MAEQVLKFIRSLLEGRNLAASSIEPIGGNNTEVFRIDLERPLESNLRLRPQDRSPAIDSIPKGTSRLVFRHTNPAAGLNEEYQIQNTVAIMSLARQALKHFPRRLVPLIFAWQDKTADFPGWAMTEFMEGDNIGEEFHAWGSVDQKTVANQIAQLLKALQDFELPVMQFGGLGFDETGDYTGRPMTIPCGGPFNSYAELCHGMLDWQANARAQSTYLSENDELGISKRLKTLQRKDVFQARLAYPEEMRPVIIHGDLHLFNLLFDKTSLELTAVLDWDFAHIAHPISEFFHSLVDFHAFLGQKSSKYDEGTLLRMSVLTAFPSPFPESAADPTAKRAPDEPRQIRWKLAQDFDNCLTEAGVTKPSNIPGAAEWADIWWFTQNVCQWFFLQPRELDKLGAEKTAKRRQEADEEVDRQLKEWKM